MQEMECAENNKKACYEFRIRDNGIGMDKEFQNHLFEAFSREHSSTISGVQGTGLGMSIAKNIVDMMGGTIAVDSQVGKGTEFMVRVSFPVCEEPAADLTNSKIEEEKRKVETSILQGKHILLVEDNELNREIAVEILQSAGFVVDTAEDGDFAVEKMETAKPGQYDLILMDIQMPRMNGYEATRRIRNIGRSARIPIVALTANAFEEDKKAAIDAGMNGHIAKPIDTGKLIRTLKELLS